MKNLDQLKKEKKQLQRKRSDEGCSYPEYLDLTAKIEALNKKIAKVK